MNSPGVVSAAAASTVAATIFGNLHVGSLATAAAVFFIAMGSGLVAHWITRREAVRQTRQIVDEAVARHVKEMHAQSDAAMQEAAGYRPDRT